MTPSTDSRPIRRATCAATSLAFALFAACGATSQPDAAAARERVGTYDPRAIAIAYANGPRFDRWIDALRAEHDAAVAAGDTAQAAALEAEAVAQQERFHAQAFTGAGVEDILAVVADALPGIRRQAGVARLEPVNADLPADVEAVDVTALLVALFEPSERALGWIEQLEDRPLR